MQNRPTINRQRTDKPKTNTIKYVFEHKQPELRRLVVKYGLAPAVDQKDLWVKTNYIVGKFKDEAMKDIADIHPDRELILWNEAIKKHISTLPPVGDGEKTQEEINKSIGNFFNRNGNKVKEEIKSSACGCSGADGEYSSLTNESLLNSNGNYSSCEGNPDCNCGKGKNNSEKTSSADGVKSFGDKLKDNLPLVVIGSLILIGGCFLYANRRA